MAELRLAALALALGWSTASAGPTIVVGPTGWPALDAIAMASADAAKADGVTVEAAGAWGDTARGCYAVALQLHGGGDASKLVDGIGTAGIATRDVVYAGAGVTLGIARAPYDGRLRAEAGSDGHVTALACFWTEREPAACAATCAGWLK
jgi:hypothetical protein